MSHSHKINTLEAFALSLATMAPTGSMAGNTGPGAKFAGINLPISFLVAAIAMLLVACGFYEMSKRIAADGSVYAYNRESLGEHWGFVSGWIIVLGYLMFTVAMTSLSGTYASLILKNLGFRISPVWLGFVLLLIIWLVVSHGIKITSNVSLVTEVISLLVLLILSLTVLGKGGASGVNLKPFVPHTSLSGIGNGVVYTVLCFVGFEVACTVATRTKNPKHSIPLALLLTIIGGAVIFVFVSYAVVIGFGINHMRALASSQAPLDVLADRFMGPRMATVIDLAIFLSAFGATICMANASSYMIYAFGEKGYLPKTIGKFDYQHNAPRSAVNSILGIGLILYLLVAVPAGVNTSYLDYITMGALCMIVIYILSCVSSFVFFKKHHEIRHSFFKHDLAPVLGFIVLLFPLASNIYPVPAFPLNLFPYAILIWAVIGYLISVRRTKNKN